MLLVHLVAIRMMAHNTINVAERRGICFMFLKDFSLTVLYKHTNQYDNEKTPMAVMKRLLVITDQMYGVFSRKNISAYFMLSGIIILYWFDLLDCFGVISSNKIIIKIKNPSAFYSRRIFLFFILLIHRKLALFYSVCGGIDNFIKIHSLCCG